MLLFIWILLFQMGACEHAHPLCVTMMFNHVWSHWEALGVMWLTKASPHNFHLGTTLICLVPLSGANIVACTRGHCDGRNWLAIESSFQMMAANSCRLVWMTCTYLETTAGTEHCSSMVTPCWDKWWHHWDVYSTKNSLLITISHQLVGRSVHSNFHATGRRIVCLVDSTLVMIMQTLF